MGTKNSMRVTELKNGTLELTNDGQLSLFFLGVGSAFTKRQYQTNLLLVKGKDHLLIDCGNKTPQALYELGLPVTAIKNYLITHTHADHIGGLEEVMLTYRYTTKVKPKIIIHKTFQNILWNFSLKGGVAFNEENSGSELTFGDMWEVVRPRWVPNYPRETYETDSGSINLKIFRTKHIPDTLERWDKSFWSSGIVIDNRILFTSDTRFDPELIQEYCSIFDIQLIIHDCQLFSGGVHASLEELKTLSAEVKSKMLLVHYGDNWEDYELKAREYGFLGLGRQWKYYHFD